MEFLKGFLIFFLFITSSFAFQNRAIEEVIVNQATNCKKTKKNHFLTDVQLKKIATLAKSKMPSAILLSFELDCKKEKRFAYIHSDIVRTLNQTLAIFIDSSNKVELVERVAFFEPFDYLAPLKWLAQYNGKFLNDKLEIRQDIDGLSGATLTARATNDAVRRVLALHKVLQND